MFGKLVKHPITILLAVLAGSAIGVYNAVISRFFGVPDFAGILAIAGDMYLFFLQMTVIPIIITAIASSLAKLIKTKTAGLSLGKMLLMYLLCILLVAVIGIGLGVLGQPGSNLNEGTRHMLGNMLNQNDSKSGNTALEMALSKPEASGAKKSSVIMTFFRDLIPSNIFYSMSFGSTLAIVFFAIIFGIAVGNLKDESSLTLTSLLTAVFEAFQKLINWSLYLLPLGLVCLLAGQISKVGADIFMAMSKFIVLFYIGGLLVFIVCTILIWLKSGVRNPFKVLASLFNPVLIALATRNSLATLPTAITSLEKKLNFDSTSVNLTLPLGMTIGRFGNILYFGLATLFVVQIYNVPLVPSQYLMILLGVIFAGTATAGASGIVTLSVINIVLNPLNLPFEAVLIIFMAIDPIIDPVRTFMIVYVNMAASALIAPRASTNGAQPQLAPTFAAASDMESSGIESSEYSASALEHLAAETTAPKHRATGPSKAPETRHATEPAPSRHEATLNVFLPGHDSKPFFYHDSMGNPQGLEIQYLKELCRRMKMELRVHTSGNPQHDAVVHGAIAAGAVASTGMPHDGLEETLPYAIIEQGGEKKKLCFLVAGQNGLKMNINALIRTLNSEKFLQNYSKEKGLV